MFLQLKIVVFALFFLTARGEYLPGFVSDAPELKTFFTLLQSTPELYDEVKKGDVTVLAPTNAAFADAKLTDPSAIDPDKLTALLSYHILRGVQPSASFGGSATFFTTLLTKSCCPIYTNSTSGIVVEGKEIDGSATVLSALYAQSKITTDYFFRKGLVHEIDRVLTIPEPYAQTVTAANLTYFVALGEHTKLIQSGSPKVTDVEFWADITIFAPNSPDYSTDFTGWDDLSLSQDLELWFYHLVNGSALYSSKLRNGAQFTTAAGLPVTVWTSDGEVYINNAKIIERDLLQANGVIQVLDRPLNPNNTHARPAFAQDPGGEGGLSSGAKAGVGVGVVLVVLLVAAGVGYWFWARRRKRGAVEIGSGEKVQLGSNEAIIDGRGKRVHETYADETGEMATKANTWELESRNTKQELPGDRRSRHELP